MSEIKDTDDVDRPDEVNSKGAVTSDVDKELDDHYNEYIKKDISKEFKYHEVSSDDRNRVSETERNVLNIVENGKDGIDYKFNDLGKKDVEVSKIDSPNIGPKDFEKHSMKEMEEYISKGGLERDIKKPELIKFDDRYFVDNGGHHRVFMAKHMGLEKITANVKELTVLNNRKVQ